MAEQIGIVGFSGTGKSSSLRNLNPEETFVITPSKESLPFKGAKKSYTVTGNPKLTFGETDDKGNVGGNVYKTKSLTTLTKCIKVLSDSRPEIKVIVVEDFTHFFSAYLLSTGFREQATGAGTWSRWETFGADVFDALFAKQHNLRDDLTVIHMFHPVARVTPEGERLKIKTPGTLLENTVDIASYYTYVLYTHVLPQDNAAPKAAKERYKFVTNDDGYHPAKTPADMFDELYIDNDLAAVIEAIKEY